MINLKDRICVDCNEVFQSSYHVKRCPSCKDAAYQSKLKFKGKGFTAICKDCNIEFEKKYSVSIVCGPCKEKRDVVRLKPVIMGSCPVCLKEFNTRGGTKKSCSYDCSEIINKVKVEKSEKNLHRFDIFRRDSFKCVYCGQSSIEDGVKLCVEHIYPKEKGGTNSPYNVVTSCNACNLTKGNKILPKDIIYRIWVRTAELSSKSDINFNELVAEFDKHYKVSTN